MLSIAERRTIAAQTANPDFRDLMLRDPRHAVEQAVGKRLPEGRDVRVLKEGDVAWSFVLLDPAGIDAELPEPRDLRSAVENDVYRLLRDEPGIADVAEKDPVAFLRDRFGVEVAEVDVRREGANETLLVLPNVGGREQLTDDMLDLVAGGGDSGTQDGALRHKYGAEGG